MNHETRSLRAGPGSRSFALSVLIAVTVTAVLMAAPGGQDCNENLIPDDEDIATGTSEDCNNNGIPDECDTDGGGSLDCNSNGIPDACEVASGAVEDCNGNEIPDACETVSDCNGNLVPDECDLASGTSEDCNGNDFPDDCENDCNNNGRPDSCDVADGIAADCNSNNFPDVCEIEMGLDPDCNSSGVPDSCEIVGDPDCNGNGIIDECDILSGNSSDCNMNGIIDLCESADCNTNGTEDVCDIFTGASEDCNSNGLPDECEVFQTVEESALLSPIGASDPQSFVVPNVDVAGSDVTLSFEATGDFGAVVESMDVDFDGTYIGTVFVDGSDCPATPDTDAIMITAAEFNALIVGSALTIDLETTPSVDSTPKLCASSVRVTLEYFTSSPSDQNGNGIPDICECPADLDGSGDTGFGDVLLIISNWGPCGGTCREDLDGDDDVGFMDVLTVLSLWGPCG